MSAMRVAMLVGLAILIALPLGIVAAVWRGSLIDFGAMTLSLLGISMAGWNAILSLGSAAVIGVLLTRGRR